MRKKKIWSILILILMLVSLTACGQGAKETNEKNDKVESNSNKKEDAAENEEDIENEEDAANEENEEEVNSEFEMEFTGIAALDVSLACESAFGSDDKTLAQKKEITSTFYNNNLEAIKDFDNTFYSLTDDTTEFLSSSDGIQKSIKYDFGRNYIEDSEYPEGDCLNYLSTDLTFDSEVNRYQIDVGLTFKVLKSRGGVVLQDRDKKVITTLISDVDINKIESAVNEINNKLKTSDDYTEIELDGDNFGYSLMVDGAGEGESLNIQLTYSKEFDFK